MKKTILDYLHFPEADLKMITQEKIVDEIKSVPEATDYYASLSELELGLFQRIKLRRFENGSTHIWLWADQVSLEQFAGQAQLLVGIYGPDCNGKGPLLEPHNERTIIDNYFSRYWEFDLHHQCFDEQIQKENEFFYIVQLTWNEQKAELELIGFDNLLIKNQRRIIWL